MAMMSVVKMDEVRTPIVIVNLKTYSQGTGKKALKLAESAEKVSKETGLCFAVATPGPREDGRARRFAPCQLLRAFYLDKHT